MNVFVLVVFMYSTNLFFYLSFVAFRRGQLLAALLCRLVLLEFSNERRPNVQAHGYVRAEYDKQVHGPESTQKRDSRRHDRFLSVSLC